MKAALSHIEGIVVTGRQLGRTIGFPTANIRPDAPPAPMPADGVYAALLYVENLSSPLPCMLNQGSHPTVPGGGKTIEAHIFDFDANLYGSRVQVDYLRFLRPERRFESLEALKKQLEADCLEARRWLALNI